MLVFPLGACQCVGVCVCIFAHYLSAVFSCVCMMCADLCSSWLSSWSLLCSFWLTKTKLSLTLSSSSSSLFHSPLLLIVSSSSSWLPVLPHLAVSSRPISPSWHFCIVIRSSSFPCLPAVLLRGDSRLALSSTRPVFATLPLSSVHRHGDPGFSLLPLRTLCSFFFFHFLFAVLTTFSTNFAYLSDSSPSFVSRKHLLLPVWLRSFSCSRLPSSLSSLSLSLPPLCPLSLFPVASWCRMECSILVM